MLNDRILGQLIVCVDYMEGCQKIKRILKMYSTDGEPNLEEFKRLTDDVLTLSKMLHNGVRRVSVKG